MTFINKKLARSIIGTSIFATLGLTSYHAAARVDALPVSFETRSEAQLQLIQALDFGKVMGLSAFSDCTLDPAVTEWSTTPFTTTDATASAATATGSGCTGAGAVSKLGHYVIVGDPSTSIKLTLTTTTGGTDFNFAPTGAYDIDPAAAAGALIAIASDAQTTIPLGASGKAGLYLGGTLTIGGSTLTAGTTYTMNFDVDVTF